DARTDFITPPEVGTIAPRAARLPGVHLGRAAVLEASHWEAIATWLVAGGRLAGLTVAELARLACVATPRFAETLGSYAARAAGELGWERCGPMRDSGGLRNPLRPLEEAARQSPSAADALAAARRSCKPG
ncbi:MAG: hypothetical protein AAGC55_02655, partial [Myxococcota bacterium]